MSRILVLSATLLLMGCASAPPAEQKPPREVTPMVGSGAILQAWTQIVSGKAVAMALVEGPCPAILLDDQPAVRMTARPNPPATLCEHPLALPDGRPASRARVADRLLPLPETAPARIAVIGEISAPIAKTIARRQMPTLVVFLGDPSKPGFFESAAELLQVAPWLMARENPAAAGFPVHAVRLWTEAGEGRSYLMLVRKSEESWDATFSSPEGDETRDCRLTDTGIDCGFPAVETVPD